MPKVVDSLQLSNLVILNTQNMCLTIQAILILFLAQVSMTK
jgi:hypothetical protein